MITLSTPFMKSSSSNHEDDLMNKAQLIRSTRILSLSALTKSEVSRTNSQISRLPRNTLIIQQQKLERIVYATLLNFTEYGWNYKSNQLIF